MTTVATRPPESAAWLALYDEARAAIDDPAWAAPVPSPAPSPPFIDGIEIAVNAHAAARLVGALLREPVPSISLLQAALAEDDAAVAVIARDAGIVPALAAVVGALAAMPLLQACRSAWAARIPADWLDAACPVCGAWATLVEARGLERRLRHRCGRCGADWAAEPVRCAFCGTREHASLVTLVSERAAERGRVEACGVCRGYLKTVTTLSAAAPAEVALLDLDTVHLDIAAIEHDFRRPPPKPRRVRLTSR